MSALGQKQTSDSRPVMSALPPKADIAKRDENVRFSVRKIKSEGPDFRKSAGVPF
jgi:hypothetical protein